MASGFSAPRSLVRYLAGQGMRPLVVDWGTPGEEERHFDLSDYIAARLESAFEAALAATGARQLLVEQGAQQRSVGSAAQLQQAGPRLQHDPAHHRIAAEEVPAGGLGIVRELSFSRRDGHLLRSRRA